MLEGVEAPDVLEVCAGEALAVDAHGHKLIRSQMPIRLAQVNVLVKPARPGGVPRLEIAASSRHVRVCRRSGAAADRKDKIRRSVPLPVIIEKEKELVLPHRAAYVSPELIEVIRLFGPALGLGDGIEGVQRAVTIEFEPRTVERIRAGFCDHVDHEIRHECVPRYGVRILS